MPGLNVPESTTRTQRRASSAVGNTRSPQTPNRRRPALPSQPHSEPANLPTRHRSRPPAVSPSVRRARGRVSVPSETEDDSDAEDDNCDAEDDDSEIEDNSDDADSDVEAVSDAQEDDSDAEDDDSEAEDNSDVEADSDADDDDSLPKTPCPACHRGARGLQAGSQSSSRSTSPDDLSDPIEGDSDTSLGFSRLSLGSATDSPVPSVDFYKQYPEPLPRDWIDFKVFHAIRNQALNPKEAKRGKDGYIYILEDKNHRGYLKIGETTKPPDERCKEIQRKCKKVRPELIQHQDSTKVPCCKRLERIIFADLRHEKHFFCCNCGNSRHVEWFKMSKKEARLRVRLWQNWMRREPYDSQGVLKCEWRERMDALEWDRSYAKTTEAEHASGKWWQTFMKEFPNSKRN
ncbi:MAG: hypothetical protein Q9195_002473 [Heterodermia aff. obscurata]